MKNKVLYNISIFLLIFCASAIFATNKDYFSLKLSVNFPSKIEFLELQDLIDFEKNYIGLDIGLSHRADEICFKNYLHSNNPKIINQKIKKGV